MLVLKMILKTGCFDVSLRIWDYEGLQSCAGEESMFIHHTYR